MSETIERNDEGIDSLRSRMDADARFRRALSGYDPQDVRAYVENVKRIFSQQARAAKQEQEDLITQLEAAKSEILARNCGIKKIKDILVERETQLNTANARINTLLQAVKKHVPEREELEYLREQVANGGMTERMQSLESETQELRTAVTEAAKLIETWKAERERILEENNQLRQEVQFLRDSAAKAAQQQEMNHIYASPVVPPAAAEARYAPGVQQAEFSQTIDKLAMMFAEAYRLVSQLKNSATPAFQPEFPSQFQYQPQPQYQQPQYQQPQQQYQPQPQYQQPQQQYQQQPQYQQPQPPQYQQPQPQQPQQQYQQQPPQDQPPQPQQQPQQSQAVRQPPFMQILRPEGTSSETFYTRK